MAHFEHSTIEDMRQVQLIRDTARYMDRALHTVSKIAKDTEGRPVDARERKRKQSAPTGRKQRQTNVVAERHAPLGYQRTRNLKSMINREECQELRKQVR